MSDDPLQMFAKRSRTPPATVTVSAPRDDEGELALVTRDEPRPAPVILTGVENRRPVGRPPGPVGERWVDHNRRASYYLSDRLIEAIDEEAGRARISKSELVRQAVELWIATRL